MADGGTVHRMGGNIHTVPIKHRNYVLENVASWFTDGVKGCIFVILTVYISSLLLSIFFDPTYISWRFLASTVFVHATHTLMHKQLSYAAECYSYDF